VEVILMKKVANLGNLGEKVDIRAGYGRNFLIPQGYAVPATADNLKRFEERRSELEQLAAEAYAIADERREELDGRSVTIARKAGDEGRLFGSVGTGDIAEAVVALGLKLNKQEGAPARGPPSGPPAITRSSFISIPRLTPPSRSRSSPRASRATWPGAHHAPGQVQVPDLPPSRRPPRLRPASEQSMSDPYDLPYPEQELPSGERLRIPPHSNQAEQSLLGGLMLDNQTWDSVADKVGEGDFYRREHRLIFGAIRDLAAREQPFDVVTLAEMLERTGQLEDAGGLPYLGVIATGTPSAANVKAYAKIVRERSVLRQLISVGTGISDIAFNTEGREVAELLDEAERRVFEIAEQEQRGGGGFQSLRGLLGRAVERIEILFQRNEPITGLPTGFADFDEMTSGLQPSDLIIVAGRPSMGKTSFAMNLAENVALEVKRPVAIFSMEMPGDALAMRMMSSLGRIDQHRVRTGKLEEDEWPRLTSAVNMLADAPVYIDDTPALSPTEVRARARRLKREHGDLALIVLDYLQLMQVPGNSENRATEISAISRSLKALAKELKVPVVALSQLNRSLEQRPNKRPVMSDLRECVTGDTLVLLADGSRVPIRDLVGQTPEVLSMNEQGRLIKATSDKVWRVGPKPVFKVRLASGRRLSGTANHRLYGAEGWRTIGELRAGDRLGTARLASYAELLDDEPLRNQASSDIFWDRIVAIEEAGEEEVFDLTVPGPASWLADGIVSHNSGAIEQDADLIVFIYRDEVYHEDSKDKGVAEIIIGKQRNGPIGTTRLTFLGKYTKFENYISDVYGDEGYR
jgi:replicative DNA helicase